MKQVMQVIASKLLLSYQAGQATAGVEVKHDAWNDTYSIADSEYESDVFSYVDETVQSRLAEAIRLQDYEFTKTNESDDDFMSGVLMVDRDYYLYTQIDGCLVPLIQM